MAPIYVSAFFALLAAIFLILSTTTGTPLARRVWRRIGVIFAVVALVLFAARHR